MAAHNRDTHSDTVGLAQRGQRSHIGGPIPLGGPRSPGVSDVSARRMHTTLSARSTADGDGATQQTMSATQLSAEMMSSGTCGMRSQHGAAPPRGERTKSAPPPGGTKQRAPLYVAHTRPDKYTETGYRWGFSAQRGGGASPDDGSPLPSLDAYRPSLSDAHPRLPEHDPKAHGLIEARKAANETAADADRRAALAAHRTARLDELKRRKAERETVENYVQIPFTITRGLIHGCDVMDSKARRRSAVEASSKRCRRRRCRR